MVNLYFSLDDPISGSGDHENVYGEHKKYLEIYDDYNNVYGDCVRKAINAREIHRQTPWHSLSNNHFWFSDLSGRTKSFLKMTELELAEARNTIQYYKTIKSSYG